MSHSAYLEGLTFRGASEGRPEETKTGVPFFSGVPHDFESWKFRVQAKVEATKQRSEDRRDFELSLLVSKLADGLIGDASIVARDLGPKILGTPKGAEELLKLMEETLLPNRREEARDLHEMGTRSSPTPMWRQYSESMISHCPRRKRVG